MELNTAVYRLHWVYANDNVDMIAIYVYGSYRMIVLFAHL